MTSLEIAILCLAFVSGLLTTGIPGQVGGFSVGAIALLALSIGLAAIVPRFWKECRSRVWLAAGVIGFLAALYFQVRMPQPGEQDVSRLIQASGNAAFEIQGAIDSSPRLTRSQKIQFWLAATDARQKDSGANQAVTGRVYVTVPLLQGTGLYPGQSVTVTGSLYEPKPSLNPGGFNFEAYLAREGGFVGLSGYRVEVSPNEKYAPPLLWQVRKQIVRSQVAGLAVPEGAFLSAMVMGRNGVDLSFDLQDQFSKAGLAHALAASGFQVSLLVSVIVLLTKRLPSQIRLATGIGTVLLYIGLTGIQPSVLRAGVMGIAALFALTAERKVKPIGTLLLSAVLLLAWNPLWIWDLGFQFSFLATLGLLVTVPVVTTWMDWLPSAIAPLFAVPIAAYVWTLPLQLYVFGVVSPYSIPANILTTPFITIVSMGGMISALAALMSAPLGSAIAFLLHYPILLLIQFVAWCNQLPGNSVAIGTISSFQAIGLYGLILLIWWRSSWWKYWWLALGISLSFITIPAVYAHTHLFQVTVLATSNQPVLVIEQQGKVALINSGSETDVRFTVLPFLRQEGINRVDWAIRASSNSEGNAPQSQAADLTSWMRLLETVPIQTFYENGELHKAENQSNPINPDRSRQEAIAFTHSLLMKVLQAKQGQAVPLSDQPLAIGANQIRLLQAVPPVLKFRLGEQIWLMLPTLEPSEQNRLIAATLPTAQVLVWSGNALKSELLEKIQPTVAIATGRSISPETEAWLKQKQVTVYQTRQTGAVQWQPPKGFLTVLKQEA